jgi:aspartyl-tRNA(Asn)/glutamyl-tRNA(Gln) amidotransferase subunit A
MSDFIEYDLVGVADAIAARRCSAEEVTAWSLGRLETIGQGLNATFRIEHGTALTRARALDAYQSSGAGIGPLHGVPLAHKDLFSVAGQECHAGSLILRGTAAARNAWVIDQLDAAGQVNLGSLHMAEFALSPTGFNQHYGHGRNPWNADYVCGGSSSGSGIAVAARLVFGSLGSDTGGSIRHPAAMCGVTGLKTTHKRVSVEGVFPLATSLDCVGPMAQSARDCARLLTHISAPNPDDALCTALPRQDYEAGLDGDLRGVRIGVPRDYYRVDLDAEVAAALAASLEVLVARGAQLVDVGVPDMQLINAMMQLVMQVESAALHRTWLASRSGEYADQVRARIEPGLARSAVDYADALSRRAAIAAQFLGSCFAGCDLIHIPTIPVQTPTIAATTGDAQAVLGAIAPLTHATRGINYLGFPAISVPAGFSEAGMPLAFQLVGKPFDEALLLQAADAFQRDTGWHRRLPPVH